MYRREHHQWIYDNFSHEQSLVFRTEKGLVIFNSCCHGGIGNIIHEVAKTFPAERVYGIIGGFHLQHSKEEILEKTTNYLVGRRVEVMYPCHCTDLKAKMYLGKRLVVKELGVGLKVVF